VLLHGRSSNGELANNSCPFYNVLNAKILTFGVFENIVPPFGRLSFVAGNLGLWKRCVDMKKVKSWLPSVSLTLQIKAVSKSMKHLNSAAL